MRLVAAFLAAVTAVAIGVPVARADGDPASDYLLGQNLFLPFDAKIPATQSRQLSQLLTNAARAGFRIRVALISTRYDLGSVTVLYGKPQKYAEFLGAELFFAYRGRLLVVMPNGYGYSKGGKPLPLHGLAGLTPPGNSGTKLVAAAEIAVRKLAAAAEVKLALPHPSGGNQTASDRIKIIAIVLTAAALVGSWMLIRRLRTARARRQT